MARKKKIIHVTGKRKQATARATVKQGTGVVKINNKPLSTIQPEIARLMIKEPILIADKTAKEYDFSINVKGGGITGQASAVRQAIAKALVECDKSLKQKFLDYDRSLLVADSRRTEPHKPSRSRAGPRRHKQRSKR